MLSRVKMAKLGMPHASPPQSNLGRARRSRATTQQSPHLFQWGAHTSKLALPLRRSPPPSNTPIPQPTPLTIPNGIRIQSAVLPQYTFRTDRQTDRPTDLLSFGHAWLVT